jgi:hypothetical protein
MKTLKYIFSLMLITLALNACQDKDIESIDPIIGAINPEAITGELVGDDYVWTWTQQQGYDMVVSTYNGSTLSSSETVSGNTFTHKNIDTNVEYTYVFKLTDGTNRSEGVVKRYTRLGANKITGLSMAQVDKQGGYDAEVTWNAATDANQIMLTATNGSRNINETLAGTATSYTIPNVLNEEEWTVTLVAENAQGTSPKVSTSLRIGKTAIGYLSIYSTPEELIANGDDDEASAWLWLKEEYPSAQFIYFGDITSANTLSPYRVLFWMRDIEAEGVGEQVIFTMPDVVNNATPSIKEWYTNGGNMLLWAHAVPYAATLGRIDMNDLLSNDRACGWGFGGYNGDTWKMAVALNPGSKFKKDHSTHQLFRGIEVETTDRTKLIAVKGPGWTQDHNCCFFNLPTVWTGIGSQEEACYNTLTNQLGIYPLATWDSQIDWVSQLNIWEAQQGNTQFKGTLLCVGNGGCEFSMKNPDGTPDKSAYPKNNIYQDNILKMAKNALEYLKTR